MFDRSAHWEGVYASKSENEVSWFQENPAISLELIKQTHAAPESAIIDIGGGASRLVDALLHDGYRDITVLDLSAQAFEQAKRRIGPDSAKVEWIVADVTKWKPARQYRGVARSGRVAFPHRGRRQARLSRTAFDPLSRRADKSSSARSRWTVRKNAAACRCSDMTARAWRSCSARHSNSPRREARCTGRRGIRIRPFSSADFVGADLFALQRSSALRVFLKTAA